MTTGNTFDGDPHARFGGGKATPSATSRRGTLLYTRQMIAAATLAVCWIAAADLPMYWYNFADGANYSGFENAAYWYLDGNTSAPATEPPNAANDYGVKDGKQLRSPEPTASGAAYTFNGHSLPLGAKDASKQGNLLVRSSYHTDLTFANDGLYGHAGFMGSWNGNGFAVRGKLTVDAPSGNPFRIYESGGNSGNIDIYAPVYGNGHLWLHSRLQSGSQVSTDKRCYFHADALRNFTGTIRTYWCEFAGWNLARTETSYTHTFLADGSFPGHLNLLRWSSYEGYDASNVFTVAKLTLGEDATVRVAVAGDASTNSLLCVTNTFTVGGSRLSVRPVGSSAVAPTLANIDAATASAPYTFAGDDLPFLRVPAGTDLSAAVAAFNRERVMAEFPTYHVTADEDGRTLRFEPEFKTVVRRADGVKDGWDKNSFTGIGNDSTSVWNDGNAPTDPDCAYLVGGAETAIRARRATSQSDATVERFQGGALILYNTNPLLIQNTSGGLEFPDLRAIGGRVSVNNLGDYGTGTAFARFPSYVTTKPFEVKGRILVKNAGTENYYFQFNSYLQKVMDVSAEIAGEGRIHLTTSTQSGSSLNDSFIGLFGPNTNFFGHIYVASGVSGVSTHLYIREPVNLGGPRPAWMNNALWLERNSYIHPLASMTLDDPNFGILCKATTAPFQNTFDITNDVVFACKSRISHASVIRKTGAGTFALGGPHPYYGNMSSTVPVAGSNQFVICEGALKPLSSEAFQGLEVVMSNGTEIVVDVPASKTDGDVGQYGMRNTEWATPFVLPAGGVTVRIEDAAGHALPGAASVREVAIATVPAAAADALRGKLKIRPPTLANGRRLGVLPTERTNGDGSITFGARLVRGMGISFR